MKTENPDSNSHPSLFYELEAIVISGKRLESELRGARHQITTLELEHQRQKQFSDLAEEQVKKNVSQWKTATEAKHAQALQEITGQLNRIDAELKSEKLTHQRTREALDRTNDETRALGLELEQRKNQYAATTQENQRRITEWKNAAEKSHVHSLQQIEMRAERLQAELKGEERDHEVTRSSFRHFQKEAQEKLNELHLLHQKSSRELKEQALKNSELTERLGQIQHQLENEVRIKQELIQKTRTQDSQLEQLSQDLNRFRKLWPEQLEREKLITDELVEARQNLADYQQRAVQLVHHNQKQGQQMVELNCALDSTRAEMEALNIEIARRLKAEETVRVELNQARETSRKNLTEVKGLLSEEKNENRKLSKALEESQLQIQNLEANLEKLNSQLNATLAEKKQVDSSAKNELEGLISSLNAARQGLQLAIEDKERIKSRLVTAMTQVAPAPKPQIQTSQLQAPAAVSAMAPPAFPLSGLLKKKEAEMIEIQAEFDGIPRGHPNKQRVQEILELITEQRDRLRGIHVQI